MKQRSLVAVTLLVVASVVVLLGAGLVSWIALDDAATARRQAEDEQRATEAFLADLAREFVSWSEEIAAGLSEGTRRRLRDWLEQEPLALYRDPMHPERIDIVALTADLVAQVRAMSRHESERLRMLTARLSLRAQERIHERMGASRDAAQARTQASVSARVRGLIVRLLLLLLGLSLLLAILLWARVVRPLRSLKGAVDRIAQGDLVRAVPPPTGGARELTELALDVERMRRQLRGLTEGLEAEVARKTADLNQTLQERTLALAELSATKDRLVQSAKMAGLGTLAGGVAHEFNNLLGGILGCLESASSEAREASVREDLNVAIRTARRAASLVKALLDVARPGERALSALRLSEVVADVLETARPTAARHDVTLHLVSNEAPEILGDEGQLHQVVLNLVTNALQASPRGGRVQLRIATAGGQVVLEVGDSGPGVAPEDRERIFEPFFTRRERGSGLGLFVSYGIVERHGGRIEVLDAPGGGALFRLILPAA